MPREYACQRLAHMDERLKMKLWKKIREVNERGVDAESETMTETCHVSTRVRVGTYRGLVARGVAP